MNGKMQGIPGFEMHVVGGSVINSSYLSQHLNLTKQLSETLRD
jgi:hypothetical protein